MRINLMIIERERERERERVRERERERVDVLQLQETKAMSKPTLRRNKTLFCYLVTIFCTSCMSLNF